MVYVTHFPAPKLSLRSRTKCPFSLAHIVPGVSNLPYLNPLICQRGALARSQRCRRERVLLQER